MIRFISRILCLKINISYNIIKQTEPRNSSTCQGIETDTSIRVLPAKVNEEKERGKENCAISLL